MAKNHEFYLNLISAVIPIMSLILAAFDPGGRYHPFGTAEAWAKIWEFWKNVFLSSTVARLGGVGLLSIVGSLLFLLRRKYRYWYAVLELTVAVGVIWQAVSSTGTGFEIALKAMTGTYLVVRGLDNLDEGKKQLRERASVQRQSAAA